MPKTTGPLRIISDGTVGSAIVVTADDRLVEGITSLTIYIEPNQLPEANLTILGAIVEVKAIPGTTYLLCPVCNEEHAHDCKPDTIGGI